MPKPYTLPPDTTLVFDFPSLPRTLQGEIQGKGGKAAASIYLPKNYRPDRIYPLVLYLQGGQGSDGRSTGGARRIVGDRGYLCANLPLFKRRVARLRKDEKNYWHRMLIRNSDSRMIWDAYRVMLARLFSVVPNIDCGRTFMGGFSNGAHTTAVLLNRSRAEIREYFQRFFLLEGGSALRATKALHRVPMIFMQGAKHKKPWLRPAYKAARQAKAKPKFVLMRHTGHAVPRRYERELKAWIRQH